MGMTENNSGYMTVEEVATLLKVTEETIRRLCREGTIPASKVGDLWRIKKSDLETYLTQNKDASK